MNKYFISTFLMVLLASTNAKPDTSNRILHRGGGNKLAKLQSMIDTECTASFICDATPSQDECTFEKLERPDITGLSEEDIQQLKEDFRATRQERKQEIIVCACCGSFTLEEMLPFVQEGVSGESGSGTGRPGMFGGGGGFRPEGAGGSGRPGMLGGGGSRPEGGGSFGFQGGEGQSGGRGGGLRNRQPIEAETELEGEESISSIDDGESSGDESSSADEAAQISEGGGLRQLEVDGEESISSVDEGDTSGDESSSLDP